MKKKGILVGAVILLSVASVGQAQEELGVTLDVTWVSKYIWRGIDRMDDKASLQPSIDLDLYGSGFSINIWTAQPCSGGAVNAEEWDYAVTYSNSLFDGEAYKTDYAVSYIYYNFPDNAAKDTDAQEFNVAFSWPEICPFGVVPSYTLIRMWPSRGGGAAKELGGYIHVFGLDYGLTLAELGDQTLNLKWAAVYNDGTGLGNGSVDHDWSHILWGISTAFPVGPGTFTPAVYYQTSMDDSVNTEDEFWTGLSYTVTF